MPAAQGSLARWSLRGLFYLHRSMLIAPTGAQGNHQKNGHLHIAQIMRLEAHSCPRKEPRINSSRYVDVATAQGLAALAAISRRALL
jgi:hypothetical protein